MKHDVEKVLKRIDNSFEYIETIKRNAEECSYQLGIVMDIAYHDTLTDAEKLKSIKATLERMDGAD